MLPLYVLFFWPRCMWAFKSLTRGQTPCTGRQSLSHWTTREVPLRLVSKGSSLLEYLIILVGLGSTKVLTLVGYKNREV